MSVVGLPDAPGTNPRKLRPVLEAQPSKTWACAEVVQCVFDGTNIGFGNFAAGFLAIPVNLSEEIGPEIISLIEDQTHSRAGLRRARRRNCSKCFAVNGRWRPRTAGKSNSASS